MILGLGAAWSAWSASIPARSADSPAVLTILEGTAMVLRGLMRLVATEGAPIDTGDIVEVDARGFARIEFHDGLIADLGPATRVMLYSYAPRSPRSPGLTEFIALDGALKLSRPKAEAQPPATCLTRIARFTLESGVVVLRIEPAQVAMFVEAGEARVGTPGGGRGVPMRLAAGEFYSQAADSKPAIEPRPPSAFVASLPKPFLESLPARINALRDAKVTLKRGADFSYAEVRDWLVGPQPARQQLVRRWRAKAGEPAFRAGLIENLRAHPEWDRVLFPEKYLPKPAPAAVGRDLPPTR